MRTMKPCRGKSYKNSRCFELTFLMFFAKLFLKSILLEFTLGKERVRWPRGNAMNFGSASFINRL